jgi:hypothetical protein
VAGTICIYQSAATTNLSQTIGLAQKKHKQSGGGIVLLMKSAAAGPVVGYGTWAMYTP